MSSTSGSRKAQCEALQILEADLLDKAYKEVQAGNGAPRKATMDALRDVEYLQRQCVKRTGNGHRIELLWLAGACVILAALISFLFLPVNTTEVEGRVQTSRFAVSINKAASDIAFRVTEELLVTGMGLVTIDRDGVLETLPLQRTEGLFLSSEADDVVAELLVVVSGLAAGSRIELDIEHAVAGQPAYFSMALCAHELFDVSTRFTNALIRSAGHPNLMAQAGSGNALFGFGGLMDASGGRTTVGPCEVGYAVMLAGYMDTGSEQELLSNVHISHLDFRSTEWDGRGSRRSVGSLRQGELRFPLLGDAVLALRRGDGLVVSGDNGRLITATTTAPATIDLDFSMHAAHIERARGNYRESLMPRFLQWWQAQDAILQIWSVAGALFGLLAGIRTWLRQLHRD